MVENKERILLTPERYLAQMTNEEDREYFSKPVRVNILHIDEYGLVWVIDPATNSTFPTKATNLTYEHNLTNRQKRALRSAMTEGPDWQAHAANRAINDNWGDTWNGW